MAEDELSNGGSGPATPSQGPLSRAGASAEATPASSSRDRAWKRLLPEQLESACLLAARGIDAATIAAVLGEPEKRVARELRTRLARGRVRALRGGAVLQEITHEREMRDLLPASRLAIRDGLKLAPAKDAAHIGLKLHEALIQKPPQRIEHQIQGRIEHDFSGLFEKLQQGLAQIREAQAGRDPLERVVRGDVGLSKHRPLLPSGE